MYALYMSLEAGLYKPANVSHIKTCHAQGQEVDEVTQSLAVWLRMSAAMRHTQVFCIHACKLIRLINPFESDYLLRIFF